MRTARTAVSVDLRAQGLEERELHGREGQVARSEGGVAAPERGGVGPEFPVGEHGGVGVEGAGEL